MIRKRSKQEIAVISLFLGGLIYHAGFSREAQDHWLLGRHQDYLHQKLMFDWPSEVIASSLDVDLTVIQPYGFSHRLTAVASRENDTGELEIEFPLLDEGRYGPLPDWRWEMGDYQFRLQLSSQGKQVGTRSLQLDPKHFFPMQEGRQQSLAESKWQIIECSPERPVYIDHPEIGYPIRTLPDRLKSCRVEVDVLSPDQARIAGPVRLDLDHNTQQQSFDGKGWPRGEYWLRVRFLKNGEPVGPYLVRQFRIEDSQEARAPRLPLRPGLQPQYLLDDWILDASSGLRHRPASAGSRTVPW